MTVLYEYGSVDLELSRSQAEEIQNTGYLSVVPVDHNRWRVTASSYVGTLVVDGREFMIRPKINPENLFLLLEPGLPPQAWQRETYDYDTTSDLLPSVIAFFARTVETTLGRGVLRSYRSRSESLITLRGRVDLPGQFTKGGVLTPTSCTFDDFTEDIPENRALRAAVRLALRSPRIDGADRRRLMQQLVALEDVADAPVTAESLDRIPINRLNRHYAPALGLARLLLANLTLTDALGQTAASSFMVDMNDLFQRFVTERLRRELRGRLNVLSEPVVHLGMGREVSMQPDLVFSSLDGDTVHVGDIKYKVATDARGRSSDCYQLLAYTTAMDLDQGTLIYCRGAGAISERTVTVRNAGTQLRLCSIDLTGSTDQVELEIRVAAEAILRASRRVQPNHS